MENIIDILRKLTDTSLGIFEIVSVLIIVLCVAAILISILIDFVEAKKDRPKKEKRSIVATGTMMMFFLFFYLLVRLRLGVIELDNTYLRVVLTVFGLAILIFGTYVNIRGRILLGRNWANHIKIYKDHELISSGVYSYVRHPLYASLIWMFYAASVIYLNYAAFLANTCIFIPFMYYRAKQEEAMLRKQFKNYQDYVKRVGMFFPRMIK